MELAYKVAARAVRQRFREQDPEALTILAGMKTRDIAVFTGTYDQIGKALDVLGLPYRKNPSLYSLMRSRIAFVNCSSTFDKVIEKNAERFVAQGGLLVTSDWALRHVLEPNFPWMLSWNQATTGNQVIPVEPNLESVWEDVVVLGADPQWWLWGSYPIVVDNPEKVRIEAASNELYRQFGSPVVAASFNWKLGQVYHVISHFWAKNSATPTITHTQPYDEFLRRGLNLSDEGVEDVIKDTGVAVADLNFGKVQSAATALELACKLVLRAVRTLPPPLPILDFGDQVAEMMGKGRKNSS